jgi:hypothetical protein
MIFSRFMSKSSIAKAANGSAKTTKLKRVFRNSSFILPPVACHRAVTVKARQFRIVKSRIKDI